MIPEEKLRMALEEYEDALIASLPEPGQCDHQFSEGFEKKMRRVRRRARHPAVYKALQRAACALLVAACLFAGLMAVDACVRASVLNWLGEQADNFTCYFFTGESNCGEQVEYELGWLLGEYDVVSIQNTNSLGNIGYVDNSSGEIIQFSYQQGLEPNQLFVGGNEYEHRTAAVGNHSADVYIALNEGKNSNIVWADSEENVLFCISAKASEEELVKLAEGVVKKD